MEINKEQYDKIKPILPVQRGRVSVDNMTFINALLYICENGCKWWRLPKEYGNRHVIYKHFNRWVKAGIINKLFQELHVQGIAESNTHIRLPDSMVVPVHPDACGALKKTGNRQSENPRAGLTTTVHMMAANATKEVDFILSAGQLHDAPYGRVLICRFEKLDIMYIGFIQLALIFTQLNSGNTF